MKNKPAFREDLDVACACGCESNEVFFHGKCHPEAGTVSFFDRKKGTLSISCHACGKLIIELAVVSKEPVYVNCKA